MTGTLDPVRVAVVGAGSMANRVHFPSLAGRDDVVITGICDLDESRLNATAERFGIDERFTDYRRMIEAVSPDAVYVIGQPEFMYDIWCWCLSQGLDLFVEKPLGLTLHQASILAHLADAHGCITQVNFQRRTSPMLQHAQRFLADRGPINHAVCTFYKCQPEPMLSARDHMMDDGVHAIDTLRAVCGGSLVDLHGTIRRIGTPDVNFFTAELIFDTGAVGVLINSWTSGRRIFAVGLHANGACAELDLEGDGVLYADGDLKGTHFTARGVAESDDFHVYAGFRAKTDEFLAAVRRREQPSSHFGDALETMRIADLILHESTRVVPRARS